MREGVRMALDDSEDVHQLAIDVVVDGSLRRFFGEEERGCSAEYLDKASVFGKQRNQFLNESSLAAHPWKESSHTSSMAFPRKFCEERLFARYTSAQISLLLSPL